MRTFCFALIMLMAPSCWAADILPLIKPLLAVGHEGKGNAEAAMAWKKLVASSDASSIPTLLTALDGANPLAANWIRSAIEAVAERQTDKLSAKDLEAFVNDSQHVPRARRLAYELLTQVDSSASGRLLPTMLNDSSVELRRDAVAMVIEQAESMQDTAKATKAYQKAFAAALDLDQVKALAEQLKKRDAPVDLPRHYGFLVKWKLVGPYDNKGGVGFAKAYEPETKLDVEGKDVSTDDDYGRVDLNKLIGKEKGTIYYATTTFVSEKPRQVEFRYSSRNATKLWLNGKLLISHEVYHAGNDFDQYQIAGELKTGKNVLLLKVCQNEQSEHWAQDWFFQLRVCDEVGAAVR